jgi:hypothetical protein
MIGTVENTVTKVLEAARRKLLDTGTRNRLVHVNRENSRSCSSMYIFFRRRFSSSSSFIRVIMDASIPPNLARHL